VENVLPTLVPRPEGASDGILEKFSLEAFASAVPAPVFTGLKRFNMLASLILALVACSPTPDAIKFEGDTNVKVASTDAVPVLKVSVMDKEKKAITPAPELTWTVTPADCAKLAGTNVQPVKDAGSCTAKVEAMVKGTQVKGSYNFTVAIPNMIEVAGYTPGTKIEMGKDAAMTATVKADAEVVADAKVTWTTSADTVAKVDETGKVTGVAEGKATITATSGKATASVEVEVGPAGAVAAVPQ